MKKEIDEFEIMKKYKFFKPELGVQHTLMCFGFECGKGWNPLLVNLFDEIQKLNPSDEFEIVQVKEKFGTLRVYTEGSSGEVIDNQIDKLIEEAELKASKTCEHCGSDGEMNGQGGWYRTICTKCLEELKKGK